MQLTTNQVLNVLQGLNMLSQDKLPVRLAWKVTSALDSFQEFAKTVDDSLQKIREKYAVRDVTGNVVEGLGENGEPMPGTIQIINDKIEDFNKEVEELLVQPVDIENLEIKLTDFPDNMEIQPTILSLLLPILRDDPVQELTLVP